MSERVLICGSRGWDDWRAVYRVVDDLEDDSIVIHGGAKDADDHANNAAFELNRHCAVVRPLWEHRGNKAGFDRNCAMLDLLPDRVIAFWDGKSPGTKGTINEARRRGIPVEVVSP